MQDFIPHISAYKSANYKCQAECEYQISYLINSQYYISKSKGEIIRVKAHSKPPSPTNPCVKRDAPLFEVVAGAVDDVVAGAPAALVVTAF